MRHLCPSPGRAGTTLVGSVMREKFGLLKLWALVVLALAGEAVATAKGPAPFMMRTTVAGQLIEGQPLEWTDRQMLLLGRDGRLHDFDPRQAENSKKIATSFRSYNTGEMKALLRREFDNRFSISTTQHFVVVHPKGQWGAWSERLESLYRSFTHYMQVRGFRMSRPKYPLVAVVFRNQNDYYAHARAGGTPLAPGTLGHYCPESNRVFLFDSGSKDWSVNAETIIHEATHQSAFNVGVHRRFAEQPRWLVEGLAMMFEARGVWDAKSTHTRRDRLNRGRLDDFRYYKAKRPKGAILALAASDQLFRTAPTYAYAEAWTLSFFLCETRPQEYCRYLERVAARPAFSKYSAKSRVADFQRVFGSDMALLDAQFLRFVDELK